MRRERVPSKTDQYPPPPPIHSNPSMPEFVMQFQLKSDFPIKENWVITKGLNISGVIYTLLLHMHVVGAIGKADLIFITS